MSETIQRFPLQWPAGWRRTERADRTRAAFGRAGQGWVDGQYHHKQPLTITQGIDRVLDQLHAMHISQDDIVISTHLRVRLDGLPIGKQAQPEDPGVAVYWRHGAGTRCMAIDRYDRVEDNLAAIAATLCAMRAIERHGGASILDRAFTGFVALPAPRAWWQVLELKGPNTTRTEIEIAHRRLISKHHPDKGGDAETAADINTARDQGLEAIR